MSYQGIRHTDQGVYVRYRIKGQVVEIGPFPSFAAALAACRNTEAPPPEYAGKKS